MEHHRPGTVRVETKGAAEAGAAAPQRSAGGRCCHGEAAASGNYQVVQPVKPPRGEEGRR